MNNNLALGDVLGIWSLMLGYQNLQENREQSKHNDVSAANDQQAAYMLAELDRKFEEQNKMLREILEVLKDERDQRDRSVY